MLIQQEEIIMDIKFIKREELQEKPDEKKLGFGKYFTDYHLVFILPEVYY